MNKQALLEDVYNSAFEDEFEKAAMIIRGGHAEVVRSLAKLKSSNPAMYRKLLRKFRVD